MSIARRSIATPRPQRTWLQRFLVALTMGDSGRNGAEVEGCWHLHRIADLEREVYGEIVSDSARDHVEGYPLPTGYRPGGVVRPMLGGGCTRHWTTVSYH